MKKYVIILLIVNISCKQREREEIIPVNMTDTITAEAGQSKNTNEQLGDTIRLTLKNTDGSYLAEGNIDSLHSMVYVKFKNEDSGKLRANLNTATEGNLRFNQIIFPNQTTDGPFGKNLELELNQIGEHSLVIGHSLMAENPYYGKFTVKVEVAKD